MIQLLKALIQNIRGIRRLEFTPNGEPFAIQGDNGTGKSGVIDAIEFGLTGSIARLAGEGTSEISLAKHGPHIDFKDKPDQAFVELEIYVVSLDRKVTIKRDFANPRNPVILPDLPEVKEAMNKIACHPEIALTRRQITKFIYSTGTKRSKDIEKLLQLSRVNTVRAALKSAARKSGSNHDSAKSVFNNSCGALIRQLEITDFESRAVLQAINQKRKILKLSPIKELSNNTSFVDGVTEKIGKGFTARPTVEKDVAAFKDSISFEPTLSKLCQQVAEISSEPNLRSIIQQKLLVSTGIELLDADQCPLCDTEWDLAKLKIHLEKKKEKLQKAEQIVAKLEQAARTLKQLVSTSVFAAKQMMQHATLLKLTEEAVILAEFISSFESTAKHLDNTEQVISSAETIRENLVCPDSVDNAIQAIQETVDSLPNQDQLVKASEFLWESERRMQSVRLAKQELASSAKAKDLAEKSHRSYVSAAESVLTALYEEIKDDFVEFYRLVNRSDEGGFSANINADQGKMDIDVDFYSRGHFPPNALHSEGHQDTMGICLYLALMRKLFGDQFRFVLLDDVVMSVDNNHRYQLCQMLKAKFPNTQFFITTHEKVWFKQLQGTGLIAKDKGLVFRGWSVDQGPDVEDMQTDWQEIESDIDKNEIESAAFLLRRHLESVLPQIVESIGGRLRFRQNQNFSCGELLDAAVSRFKELLKLALKASKSGESIEKIKQLQSLVEDFLESEKRKQIENWLVNTAIHFNPGHEFVREDFLPVAEAFKGLLKCFACDNCKSWLYLVPKPGLPGEKESLRCSCDETRFNLKKRKSNSPRIKPAKQQTGQGILFDRSDLDPSRN